MQRYRSRQTEQPASSAQPGRPFVYRQPASSRRPSKPREIEYRRPVLYPLQQEAIFEPRDHEGKQARFSWIEASTKAGKTVGCIAWIYEQAYLYGGPNKNFWWVAPVYGQAKIAFRRLKAFLPKSEYESNEADQTITLRNGAMIWFKGADKPDSLYGEDVFAAVIDEGSRCKEETWPAIRSTLTATRAPCRVIGNVKGRRNWFYRMAHAAKLGRANHAYYKITAADAVAAGVLAKEEIDDAKAALKEETFRELYYAEAADDAGNPFTLAAIRAACKPLSLLPAVCYGVDLAKKQDWTVVIGLDVNGDVCFFSRFQRSWEETTDELVRIIGGMPALVDSTGVGDPIVERLQKRCPGVVGYQFTQPSKQKLMEGLAVAIQRRETSVVAGVSEDQPSVHQEEMESFEYEYTRTGVRYTAPEGFHDDTVCAHALAVMCNVKGGVDLGLWAKLAGSAPQPRKLAA